MDTAKLTIGDITLILNMRGEKVPRAVSKENILALVGAVQQSELDFVKKHNSIEDNAEFEKKLLSEGRFKKTYSTEKNYIEKFLRTLKKKTHPYEVNNARVHPKKAIMRIHFFYSSLGIEIPVQEINLSVEQLSVVNKESGFIIVNSGPGTGKTTVAVHRALKWLNEGVIIVSFTNSAVNNLYDKIIDYIEDISLVGKKGGESDSEKIFLTTIDKLSIMAAGKSQAGTFDGQIRYAIGKENCYTKQFSDISGNIKYKHIIIDEAQDLCPLRYQLMLKIFKEIEGKSITFLGDPKQRMNSNAGQSFESLIGRAKAGEDLFLVETSLTYRFQNENLLSLCNNISSQRKHIHVELSYPKNDGYLAKLKRILPDDAPGEILRLLSEDVSPGCIAIISPIVNKVNGGNGVKADYDKIVNSITKEKFTVSDSIDINCVYASSIQSVKGLEFDYVFFVGCQNFPEYMKGTYEDINDGISINFVANTRARKMIYYVTSYELPNGVSEEYMEEFTKPTQTKVWKAPVIIPRSIDTYDIEADKYKAMEDNMNSLFLVSVQKIQDQIFQGSQRLESLRYEIISTSLALIQGKNIIQTIDGKTSVIMLEDDAVKINGDIRDMELVVHEKSKKVAIGTKIFQSAQSLHKPYTAEDTEKHQLFAELMTGRKSSLGDIEEISNVSMKIKNILEEYKSKQFTHELFKFVITAPMIKNDKVCLVFTESKYLAMLIKATMNREVIMISLLQGTFYRVGELFYSLKRYQYHVRVLYSIHTQYKVMKKGSINFSFASCDEKYPHLSVDTEFGPRKYNKSNTIYEIALIDLANPFMSLATYLRPDFETFNPYCGDSSLVYSDFKNCPTHVDFYSKFRILYAGKKPIIHYFNASHDLSIFYENSPDFLKMINDKRKEICPGYEKYLEDETFESFYSGKINHSVIPDSRQVEVADVDLWKFDSKKDYGFFSFVDEHQREKNVSNTQVNVYLRETGKAITDMRHLPAHIAFCDALALGEIVTYRHFKI